jgi:ribosomal protein S18 acetylase RimI-like enzyme
LEPASRLAVDTLAGLMTAGFENYVVPLVMSVDRLERMIRCEDIDLEASRAAYVEDEPVAIALVACRGDLRRIAAMGVVVEQRSRGVGRSMLQTVIDESRAAGCSRLSLEVIESNAPARRLYDALGFRETRTVVVGNRVPRLLETDTGGALETIEPAEVGEAMAAGPASDLPWQRAPETIARHTSPARGFRLGEATALTSNETERSVALEAIWVSPANRRRGLGRRMIEALAARYPERVLTVPARVPEELEPEFFRAVGFQPGPLRQREMVLEMLA